MVDQERVTKDEPVFIGRELKALGAGLGVKRKAVVLVTRTVVGTREVVTQLRTVSKSDAAICTLVDV